MPHGGVSPRKRGRVLHGATVVTPQAPSAKGKYPGFVFNGGPVVSSPRIFTSFWGPAWTAGAAQVTAAGRLEQFCAALLQAPFMNVLSQYGVGTGAGSGAYGGRSELAQVPAQMDNAAVQSQIQAAIGAGTIPEPPAGNPSDVLIVFLDESIEIDDSAAGLVMCEPTGDTAFGYHDFFTTSKGNPFYYAVIPALDDTCIKESCPGGDATCSIALGETQEQRRTQVTSHEFAEMTSDPQLNAWYDPQNGENGDICNGETGTFTVGSDTWTVQKIYSKNDDVATNGATYCLASAPAPEPPAAK